MLSPSLRGGGLSWQEGSSRLRLSIDLEERSPIPGGGGNAGRGPYPKAFRNHVPKIAVVQGMGRCVRIKFIAMRDSRTLKEDRFSGLCHATVSLWTSGAAGGGGGGCGGGGGGGGGDGDERLAGQCNIWLRLGTTGALRSHAQVLAVSALRVLPPCPAQLPTCGYC
jgi:hypothetical protein